MRTALIAIVSAALSAAVSHVATSSAYRPPTAGDVNGDGTIDIADPISLLDYIFNGNGQPATCRSQAPGDIPQRDAFVDNRDGTVTDLRTGLMWEVDPRSGGDREFVATWPEAKARCESFRLGGYDDWRLATPHEMMTVLRYDTVRPAAVDVFPDPSYSLFWTSQPFFLDPEKTWAIDWQAGHWEAREQTKNGAARAVRGPISPGS